MTQPSRTTESINRDNAAIRDIMHSIKDLTVPDRATLALGLIGHLATMMNRSQITKLLAQLTEEAERVQDVPPARQRDNEERAAKAAESAATGLQAGSVVGAQSKQNSAQSGGARDGESDGGLRADARGSVGQAGRGEFRSGRLV